MPPDPAEPHAPVGRSGPPPPPGRSRPPDDPASSPSFVRTGLLFYGAMGIAAILWRMGTPGDSILHPTPEAAAGAWPWSAALGSGLVAGAVTIGLSEALTRWTEAGKRLADRLAEHLARSLGPIELGDAWLLALASGLAEEMFFRGAMQAELGIVTSSLVFGAAHFLPRRDLVLWSVYAVAMGFGLGALYAFTGQLVAPIAAHVLVNGVNLPRLSARSAAQRDRVDLDPRA